MASKERPVLVAIITTLGFVIAALITSGYFKSNTAAKREDVLEAQIRQLESDLEKCRQVTSAANRPIDQTATGVESKKSNEPAHPVDLNEATAKLLASRPGSQLLKADAAATGVLAENAVKEYVFTGTANEPVLFTFDQPKEHFSAKIEILSSGGGALVRDENFYGAGKKLSFTPIKTDAYVLRLLGTRRFGRFVVEMSGLNGTER